MTLGAMNVSPRLGRGAMNPINFTAERTERLREAYTRARTCNLDVFEFEDSLFQTAYAAKLLEYLDENTDVGATK